MPRLRNSKRIKLIPTKSIHGSTDSVTVTLDPVIIRKSIQLRFRVSHMQLGKFQKLKIKLLL